MIHLNLLLKLALMKYIQKGFQKIKITRYEKYIKFYKRFRLKLSNYQQ